MTIDQFLHEVRPDLTLYGVLLTLAIFAFYAGRHLWRYEKELVEENVGRLRELMDGFRTRYVEPILKVQLLDLAEGAYREALVDLEDELDTALEDLPAVPVGESATPGAHARRGLRRAIERLTDRGWEHTRAERSLEEFFSSATGEDFFRKLDGAYSARQQLSSAYYRAKICCSLAAYSFFGLGIALLAGMVQITVPWPEFVRYPWWSMLGLLALLSMALVIRMETARRRLINQWEDLQVRGDV